jgi:LmbE family N-acetylglucosaminyl deacetylase
MPFSVQMVIGYEVWTPIPSPQLFVSITSHMKKKIQAIREHRSQMISFPYLDGIKGLGAYRAAMRGEPGYAEAFEVILNSSLFNPTVPPTSPLAW